MGGWGGGGFIIGIIRVVWGDRCESDLFVWFFDGLNFYI